MFCLRSKEYKLCSNVQLCATQKYTQILTSLIWLNRGYTCNCNGTVKRLVPCRCFDGTLKNHTKCPWRWVPDRRSNFFSPPAHLCAAICMTELSLIVTLNNQLTHSPTCTSGLKKKVDIQSGSRSHRHFVGFFKVFKEHKLVPEPQYIQ